MKTIRFFLTLVLLTAMGISCSHDDSSDQTFRVNDGTGFLSLDALARSGTLLITAPAPWHVAQRPEDSWFTLATTHGKAGVTQLGISFDANQAQARSAVVTFTCNGEEHLFRLSQSARNVGFDDADYYFYLTFATLPALYVGLDVFTHDKPSYVFYSRLQTYDPTLFPAHVTVLSPAGTGEASASQQAAMREQMMARIRTLNDADPTAVFGLYVDDIRCRAGYEWFVAQGIDSARVRVSLLSDGTATYNNFYAYFGNDATAAHNWDTYAAAVEALDWNHDGRYPQTRATDDFYAPTWAFYLATRPGYRLILQDKTLLESSGAFMDARLAEMHTLDRQPYEVLEALPAASRRQFFRMAQFDYDHFATLFDASPKPNLIIIGTNASGTNVVEQQRSYVAQVVSEYGAQYDIFFKPHPADTSAADYEQRFGLTLLPGQMPFEIFIWSLLDRIDVIGGYPSTVFLTVPTDRVRFIFAPDAASLVRPLNVLFRHAQGIEWIQ